MKNSVAIIVGGTGQFGIVTSEFLLKKGAIDMIVDRREMRDVIPKLINMLIN